MVYAKLRFLACDIVKLDDILSPFIVLDYTNDSTNAITFYDLKT